VGRRQLHLRSITEIQEQQIMIKSNTIGTCVALLTAFAAGCAGSSEETKEAPNQTASTQSEVRVFHVASSAEAMKLGIVAWDLYYRDDALVAFGLDRDGAAKVELRLHVDEKKSVERIAARVDSGKSGELRFDQNGVVTANTIPEEAKLPLSVLQSDLQTLRDKGEVPYGWLGCIGGVIATVGTCGGAVYGCPATLGTACPYLVMGCIGSGMWAADSCI
jgi:hypothetical protein